MGSSARQGKHDHVTMSSELVLDPSWQLRITCRVIGHGKGKKNGRQAMNSKHRV